MQFVLIVDDDEELCETLTVLLESRGFAVRCEKNGEDALRALAIYVPSIILLDKRMPVMDGDLFYDRIKSHKNWRDYPVMFITGEVAEGPWVTYQQKPLDPERLIAGIEKYARR